MNRIKLRKPHISLKNKNIVLAYASAENNCNCW